MDEHLSTHTVPHCYKSSRLKMIGCTIAAVRISAQLNSVQFSWIHFCAKCRFSIYFLFNFFYWSFFIETDRSERPNNSNNNNKPATNQITSELNCSCVSHVLYFFIIFFFEKFNAGTFILLISFDQFRSASNRLNDFINQKYFYR